MFRVEYPLFKRGNLLKIAMLEQLRDYPRELIQVLLDTYSDGIIRGCHIDVDDDYLIIGSGMIKYGGNIYVSTQPIRIAYESTEATSILKIKFTSSTSDEDTIKNTSQVILVKDTPIHHRGHDPHLDVVRADDELELCRFKLKKGARLRHAYQSFADMMTEYDTINLIYTLYAGYRRTTLSPLITDTFVKEASTHTLTNPLDIAFCMQGGMGEAIAYDRIVLYVTQRLGIKPKAFTHMELYDHLREIMYQIKKEDHTIIKPKKTKTRKIIVD